MITKNKLKLQIVKELLDKKEISFEQALLLVDESPTEEKLCTCKKATWPLDNIQTTPAQPIPTSPFITPGTGDSPYKYIVTCDNNQY